MFYIKISIFLLVTKAAGEDDHCDYTDSHGNEHNQPSNAAIKKWT